MTQIQQNPKMKTVAELNIVYFLGMAIVGILCSVSSVSVAATWTTHEDGAPWHIAEEARPDFRAGKLQQAFVIRLPSHAEVHPVAYGRVQCTVPVAGAEGFGLSLQIADDFTGPTAGHIFAEVRVNGHVVWSADVAGGRPELRRVRLAIDEGQIRQSRELIIELGVWVRKWVTNFPVEVVWTDVAIEARDGSRTPLMKPTGPSGVAPLPADLPLPAEPPAGGWLWSARVVQPWGRTQTLAIRQHDTWAKRLSREFGFNTIILLPPNAHNAITARYGDDDAHAIDENTFEQALKSYRSAGFRILLYSSIMHCGHAPFWQSGDLTEQHPDWRQVDQTGTPILNYGSAWLCPSTPALDYTLRYTRELVTRWNPDGIMLDNNEFLKTAQGKPTCYCESCQSGFAKYVARRFGPDKARDSFGITDLNAMRIPTTDGDLFRLWIHWRNRVWADATERFRAGLRQVKPDIVLLANTQYRYRSWLLATDMQYRHEDAVLSESRSLTAAGMSDKMLLGQALARGRPLWNYIGTFQERDFTQLRPPETIAALCAASLAYGARPWIVFYGFEQPSPALETLSQYQRLAGRWLDQAAEARRWANVISLFSTRTRNYFGRRLVPSHLETLRTAQVPVEPVRDLDLPTLDLTPYQAILAEGISCLTQDETDALAGWVRQGGTLIATPDVGWYDPIGRLRPTSLLTDQLGVTPPHISEVGEGRVVWCNDGREMVAALQKHVQPILWIEPASDVWELTAFRQSSPQRFWVHAICHDMGTTQKTRLALHFPAGIRIATASWWTPTNDQPAAIEQAGNVVQVSLPDETQYAILQVNGE